MSDYKLTTLGVLCSLLLSGCQTLTSPSSSQEQPVVMPPAYPKAPQQNQQTPQEKPQENMPALNTVQPITYRKAADYVLAHSDKLLAAQAGWQASNLQAEALESLHQPIVSIGGTAGRYHIATDINTDQLRSRLKGYGNNLAQAAQQIPELAPLLPALQKLGVAAGGNMPSTIHLSKYDNFSHGSLRAILPLYTGGRINAIQQFAKSRTDVNASELAATEEDLLLSLIQRYFQVQLAAQLVDVRKSAVKAIKGHAYAAQKMLDNGLISKVERLQAQAALSGAEFQLEKAEDDLRMTQSALNSLLHSSSINIATDIFINDAALPTLESFQSTALAKHPALAKIDAKIQQAKAVKQFSDAAWKPNITSFANYQVGSNDNWLVGLNAQWTLHSSIDRSKMQQAAKATLRQVNAIQRQAIKDIKLLVEKNWLAVNNARQRYYTLEKEQALAQEVLKLNTAGFKEGINTAIDVNDAQTKLVKSHTEQANAAYEYVMALANLLASTGEIHSFADYIPSSNSNYQ